MKKNLLNCLEKIKIMKNIHIIQTEKPTRLHVDMIDDSLRLFSNKIEVEHEPTGKHIYITSDEDVKEKDWVLCSNGNIKKVTKSNSDDRFIENWQKIILTTDQNLIKDGIQDIDDKFLEWFVNHPECDNVEVKTEPMFSSAWFKYKIIIPTEEPKLINNCPKCGLDLVKREGSTPVCVRIDCGGIILSNETLREWALNKEPKSEIMYSEEEVLELLKKSHFVEQNIEEWFEQFKKK